MILYIVVCTCLGQSMGLEPTLPYLSPELNGQRLLNGANFASAGIGILNDTGIQFVSSILSSSKFHYISLYLDTPLLSIMLLDLESLGAHVTTLMELQPFFDNF